MLVDFAVENKRSISTCLGLILIIVLAIMMFQGNRFQWRVFVGLVVVVVAFAAMQIGLYFLYRGVSRGRNPVLLGKLLNSGARSNEITSSSLSASDLSAGLPERSISLNTI